MAVQTKQVILVLADISGYTNFMVANEHDEAKAQQIVGQIIGELIDATELPLKVAKLEGDAVFMYAVREEDHQKWEKDKQKIGETIHRFFDMFAAELVKVSGSKLCAKNDCHDLNKLNLKVIIHSGEAVFETVDGFRELAGVDVILAHLLLKNNLIVDHYILVTDRAYRLLRFPNERTSFVHTEKFKQFGKVKTHIFLPPDHLVCAVED